MLAQDTYAATSLEIIINWVISMALIPASLEYSGYRKRTHTNKYLHDSSHHYPALVFISHVENNI